MRKLAIFVEGMTEQEFVVEFIKALVGKRGVQVQLAFQVNGVVNITPINVPENTEFYVLVIDCRCDGQVKTQMRDRYASLVSSGYTAILGIRDVYPLLRSDIPKIQKHLDAGWPVGPVIPKLHLAIMEVESWFIADKTHFEKIDEILKVDYILNEGFDLSNPAEDWEHPALTLHQIYRLANKSYMSKGGQKTKRRVLRTINALSFDEIYDAVRPKMPSLDSFIESVEVALFV